jgi:hypothetical protein
VDDSGRTMPGIVLADCVPVRGGGVELPVRWKGGRDLKELAGQPVRAWFQLAEDAIQNPVSQRAPGAPPASWHGRRLPQVGAPCQY